MTDIKKTEDDVLDYTQSVREDVVKKLTSNGMPGDVKDLSIILSALDGMDRAALTKKKIQAENDNMSKVGLAGAAITELLSSLRNEAKPTGAVGEPSSKQTAIPAGLDSPVVVPGELSDADRSLNYETLIKEDE